MTRRLDQLTYGPPLQFPEDRPVPHHGDRPGADWKEGITWVNPSSPDDQVLARIREKLGYQDHLSELHLRPGTQIDAKLLEELRRIAAKHTPPEIRLMPKPPPDTWWHGPVMLMAADPPQDGKMLVQVLKNRTPQTCEGVPRGWVLNFAGAIVVNPDDEPGRT